MSLAMLCPKSSCAINNVSDIWKTKGGIPQQCIGNIMNQEDSSCSFSESNLKPLSFPDTDLHNHSIAYQRSGHHFDGYHSTETTDDNPLQVMVVGTTAMAALGSLTTKFNLLPVNAVAKPSEMFPYQALMYVCVYVCNNPLISDSIIAGRKSQVGNLAGATS